MRGVFDFLGETTSSKSVGDDLLDGEDVDKATFTALPQEHEVILIDPCNSFTINGVVQIKFIKNVLLRELVEAAEEVVVRVDHGGVSLIGNLRVAEQHRARRIGAKALAPICMTILGGSSVTAESYYTDQNRRERDAFNFSRRFRRNPSRKICCKITFFL
ncbi:hypothetical protein TorRG33x02_294770 [Trema orientale]|uniref:Uncharacterized protein n=1 Tax=Trema orientale TaxID=63057 RepID=A0A2P5C7E4_TREOI|nr:hypothetical protein TorRG33x02_294770 [Trema orientale]